MSLARGAAADAETDLRVALAICFVTSIDETMVRLSMEFRQPIRDRSFVSAYSMLQPRSVAG